MASLTQSRAEFSRNLALLSVLLHLLLLGFLITLMLIRYEETLLDLFMIVTPVTAAYFITAFTWLAKVDGRGDRRGISWQSATAMMVVVVAVFVALYGVVYMKFNGNFDATVAKVIAGAVETAFGGALAVLTKEFFDT